MSTPLENVQSDTISSNTPKDQVPSPVYIKCKVIVARHLFLSQDSQPIKPNPATARTKADGAKKKTSSGIPSLQLEPLQTKKAANAPASLSQDSQPTKIKPSYSQNKDRQVKKIGLLDSQACNWSLCKQKETKGKENAAHPAPKWKARERAANASRKPAGPRHCESWENKPKPKEGNGNPIREPETMLQPRPNHPWAWETNRRKGKSSMSTVQRVWIRCANTILFPRDLDFL